MNNSPAFTNLPNQPSDSATHVGLLHQIAMTLNLLRSSWTDRCSAKKCWRPAAQTVVAFFGIVFSFAGDDDQYHYHNHDYGHHHEQQVQVNVDCRVSGLGTCDDWMVPRMNHNIQCRHQQNVHEDLWTLCRSELFISIAYSRQVSNVIITSA